MSLQVGEASGICPPPDSNGWPAKSGHHWESLRGSDVDPGELGILLTRMQVGALADTQEMGMAIHRILDS